MRYETAAAFRTALEQRLANQASVAGVAVDRLRRLAVFDRILARLTVADPGMWVLKGGAALEMRWPNRARTTKDLDLRLDSSQWTVPTFTSTWSTYWPRIPTPTGFAS